MHSPIAFHPGIIGSQNLLSYELLKSLARDMRKNPTPAEARLWQAIRFDRLGVRFRRQHVIGRFIVDFYCITKGLVIEVDGDIHDLQKEQDALRTAFLEQLGCTVLRFRNEEVLGNAEEVVEKIRKQAVGTPSS